MKSTAHGNGIFSGFLLISDMDLTLTNDSGAISDRNADAILHYQAEGGLFTVASGRYPSYILNVPGRAKPNTYVIGINGTELYDPKTGETVYSCVLEDHADIRSIICDMAELCETLTHIVFSTYRKEETISRAELTDRHALHARLDALEETYPVWHRLIFVQNAEHTADNMQVLHKLCGDRYALDRSWSEGIELHAKGSGKGALVPEMKRLLAEGGTPIHTVVCAGDYENDLSMFQTADIAYAVGNAIPLLKAAADRITVSYREDAIAHIIADLEAECGEALF